MEDKSPKSRALHNKFKDEMRARYNKQQRIDLMLVVGTSALVWPAASYIYWTKQKGARIAVINMDEYIPERDPLTLLEEEWLFQGDAAVIVPEILKDVI